MKTFICTVAFALTVVFSFANGKENIQSKSNRLLLTGYSQVSPSINKGNNVVELSLSYDVATFCAGASGYSKPTVNIKGGNFSFKRNSDGVGGIGFNTRTGIIDRFISDPGEYTITYSQGGNVASTIIKINSCK